MSFLQSLRASEEWGEACEELEANPDLTNLERYVVADIDVEHDNAGHAILLLESPHALETCRGFPLAGNTGLEVAAHLRSVLHIPEDLPNCPLGDILQNHRCNDRLRRIGTMNVSQLPMQSSAYLCAARSEFDELLFSHLRAIRDRPKARGRRGGLPQLRKRIDRLLLECLKSRIEATNQNTLWILCGDVAQAFFDKACCALGRARDRENEACVAHASRNQWGSIDDEPESVRCMKRKIERRLTSDS